MKVKRSPLTMTLEDVCQLFRGYGIPMETNRLADDIEAGIYPFGRLIKKSEKTKRRTFEIWRCDVEAFIQSKMPQNIK